MKQLILCLGLLATGACALRGQTNLTTPVRVLPKADSSAAGEMVFGNNVATVLCTAANYATCKPVTLQNGTVAQGLLVVSQTGTVSMSTESVLPIGDNTSDLGSTGASAKRWANVNSVQFFAPNGTSVSEGCWMLSFAMGCGPSVFAPTFSADRVTGQVKSAVLAGSGTVCLQTDNSGNIGKAAAGCGTMVNPMTTTGDIIYSSSGSTPARLAIGTTGNCLIASGAPVWLACDSQEPAWTSFTPTVSSTSGAVTTGSLSAAYRQSGKTIKYRIFWSGQTSLATTGIQFTTPVNPLAGSVQSTAITYGVGSDTLGAGAIIFGTLNFVNAQPTGVGATFPATTNESIVLTGVYQSN